MSNANSDLVLHIKLNSIKANKVNDLSGNKLNAALSGSPKINSDDDFGYSIDFDGLDDLGIIKDKPALRLLDYTVEVWIKPNGAPNEMWKGIVGKPGRNFNIWLHSSGYIHHRFHTSTSSNGGAPNTVAGSIKWDEWNHVAITNDGKTAKTYINGNEAASGKVTGQLVADSTPLIFGGNLDGNPGNFFKGGLSNLRIYNRVLTPAEILKDIQADLTGLTLYMKLDEVEQGNKVTDSLELNEPGILKENARLASDDTVGGCIRFDGTKDYIEIPNSEQFNFKKDDDFTVGVWIRTDNPQTDVAVGDNDVVEKWNGIGSYPFVFRYINTTGQMNVSRWDGTKGPGIHSKVKINDGKFHHVAFAKNGSQLLLFIDGKVDGKTTDTTTKATDSTSPLFLASRGGFRNFFKGRLAHLRVYDRALSEEKVQAMMKADQTSFSAFNKSHPIDFSFSDNDHQNVFYILDDPKDDNISLEILNTSSQNVNFLLNDAKTAGPDNYHFEFRFRPSTLTAAALNNFNRNDADWSITNNKNDNGTDSVFLLSKKALTLEPDKPVKLEFSNISANGLGGARGTRVELRYQNLKYPDNETNLSGFRERHFGIINHRGKKNIPLHVGFVGSNTVLNDNDPVTSVGSESDLVLRITNLSNQAIPLSTDKKEFSKLIISFDVEPKTSAPWDKPWALGKISEVDQINITNIAKWEKTAPAKVSENPEWVFTNKTQKELAAGGSIQIKITKIKSSLPSGHAKVYIDYENIPGYWDGQFVCTLEKQPLLFRGTNVGVGISNPNQALVVNGTHNKGRQTGSGMTYGGSLAIRSNAPQIDFIDTDHKDWSILVNSDKLYFVRQPWNYQDLVLDGKGNVGIGTDNPGYKLDVNGTMRANIYYDSDTSFYLDANGTSNLNALTAKRINVNNPSGDGIIVRSTKRSATTLWAGNEGDGHTIFAVNTSKFPCIGGQNNDANGWDFWAYGNKHYGHASSIRLKKSIKPIKEALQTVLKLRGVSFQWKSTNGKDIGFIAEEVGKLIPEAVTRQDDGTVQGMSYDHVIPVLVEALKEQQKMIDNLRKTIVESKLSHT